MAYPRSAAWKDETVWAESSRLANTCKVSTRISELIASAAAENEVTVERVMRELARVAFGDPRQVMSWGPGGVKLRESSELTDDEAVMVAEVSQSETQTKIKTHDKLKALELIGRKLGMWKDKQEITGKDGAPLFPQDKQTRDAIVNAAIGQVEG